MRERMDPRRLIREERRRLAGALEDLESRVAAGTEMEELAMSCPSASVRELALMAFELRTGPGLRARTLFAPLAQQLRNRLAILEGLERA